MRTVTVERKKSLVGALVPIALYVEDHESSDMMIHDAPCRKVGELKNDDLLMFEIGDEETKLYAFPPAQVYYPELMRIPAGTEDVALRGKCVSDASTGVSFRFEDNDTDETRELHKNRSKAGTKGLILTSIVTLFLVLGFSLGRGALKDCVNRSSDKTFNVQEMSITLDKTFRQDTQLGFAGYFTSGDAGIFVERVGFDEMEGLGEISAEDFAKFALIGGDYDGATEVKTEGGVTYFEFSDEDPASKETVKTLVSFYKSGNAFWDIQFISLEKDYARMRPLFMKWAKTITFDD